MIFFFAVLAELKYLASYMSSMAQNFFPGFSIIYLALLTIYWDKKERCLELHDS